MIARIYTVTCLLTLTFVVVEASPWLQDLVGTKDRWTRLSSIGPGIPDDKRRNKHELGESDDRNLELHRPARSIFLDEAVDSKDVDGLNSLDRHYKSHRPAKRARSRTNAAISRGSASDLDRLMRDLLLLKRLGRWKRHHERQFIDGLSYRAMSEDDRQAFHRSRGNVVLDERHFLDHYEVEVRQAQNSSVCNYTVISIPDPTNGLRIPRQLEHIKCNHVGSRCHEEGTYCCLQTYRNVEVFYANGRHEIMKIYSGCVCSLQIYGTLEQYRPDLPIND